MLSFPSAFFVLLSVRASADTHRSSVQRLRHPDSQNVQSSPLEHVGKFFRAVAEDPFATLQLLAEELEGDEEELDEFEAILEIFQSLADPGLSMSMDTSAPSVSPVTPVFPPAPILLPPPVTAVQDTQAPTLDNCRGITEVERILQIFAILDTVANPSDVRDNSTPQGLAATWLIAQDDFQICPDNAKIIQRWALAVMYFSTGGDDWFQCSRNPAATNCGDLNPFVGDERFLSDTTECAWAGINCIDGCVTRIEFEANNLVGTIPSEIGLLSNLIHWGMERGNLTSTIPTEVGLLTNLIFIDLDFNELTGNLDSVQTLSGLKELDLNNNKLSGSISSIGGNTDMEFLQLHNNAFSGAVPSQIGAFSNLAQFTLHKTLISGSMPLPVCDLLLTEGNGGVLTSLIADCTDPNPEIDCTCCTQCRLP